MSVKGYKVFDPDWTCRDFKYEVGKVYEENIEPKLCKNGFHFCENLADCFNYYRFNPNNKVAEIIALGDIDKGGDKSCTNKIGIVRQISWYEVLDLVNIGKNCTGINNSGDSNSGNRNSGDYNSGNYNSGDYNSGNYNSGYRNIGNYNSGDYNSGDYNSGYRNSGNYNSGDYNSGDYNSGNYNSGSYNSGDWNKTSYSNGYFNTVKSKVFLFNKLSEWTNEDWLKSDIRKILGTMPKNELSYVNYNAMSEKQRKKHPEARITGGYLKELDNSNKVQEWWNNLSNEDKNIIKSIPNFDKEIFKEITSIDVDE